MLVEMAWPACHAWAWRHEDGDGMLLVQVAIAFATPMMSRSLLLGKDQRRTFVCCAGRQWTAMACAEYSR